MLKGQHRFKRRCLFWRNRTNFRDRSEYKMIHVLGGDAVGMSTVQEVIAANHAGMDVFAMSVITDIGIREEENQITHAEVLEAARNAEPKFSSIFRNHCINGLKMIRLKTSSFYKVFLFFIFCCSSIFCIAQNPSSILNNMRNARGSSQTGQGGDSLQRRNRFEDSITIRFYYMDSIRPHKFDSSIADFTSRFPIKATDIYLGNTGSPTKSLLFSPSLKAGWDAGFHAYDTYKWNLDDTRFYNTTRPYTELGYMIASKAEQIIQITHTQNIKPILELFT